VFALGVSVSLFKQQKKPEGGERRNKRKKRKIGGHGDPVYWWTGSSARFQTKKRTELASEIFSQGGEET